MKHCQRIGLSHQIYVICVEETIFHGDMRSPNSCLMIVSNPKMCCILLTSDSNLSL